LIFTVWENAEIERVIKAARMQLIPVFKDWEPLHVMRWNSTPGNALPQAQKKRHDREGHAALMDQSPG
jgi:hypothetical protein